MIRLTIDGQEIEVREGTMVADAAARLGIDVPVYCYHEALGPLGACRMCLVQIEKMPKLATACTTAVSEGMVVHTSGAAVDKGRKGVLEFLLINHPLDCPVCDKGGECFLQDYTFQYGPPAGRFEEPKIQKVKDGPINELVMIDQERCVLCQRCVRFMEEYVGEPELLLDGRGVETVVSTVEGQPAQSQFIGNVIDLCPVGALLSKPYQHKARPWNMERQEAVCTLCPVGCTTLATGRENHIVRVEGRPVLDRSWGWLCDRGRFGYDWAYNPARLGVSRLAGQEQAQARTTRQVGEWLKETLNTHGPESVAFVMGGMHSIEEARQVYQFATEVVGSQRLAVSRDVPGYLPRALNGTFDDIDKADAIVLVGVDAYDAVPVVHLRLRERQRAKQPVRIVGIAPWDLGRPSLAVEMVSSRVGEEALQLAYALQKVRGQDAAVTALAAPAPRAVDEEAIAQLAQVLMESEHLTILWDGLEADVEPVLTALQQVRADKPTRVLPTWGPSNWRGFEAAGFPARLESLTQILEDAQSGKIQMLFTFGADLLRDYPNAEVAEEALQRIPHVVAEALFLPTGSEHYGAVLPQAGPGEVAGTYVNMESRLQASVPSVQPHGQSRPVKSYLASWAHALGRAFVTDEDWDAYGEDSADLLPADPAPMTVRPIASRPEEDGGMALATGVVVMDQTMPSENLAPRVPQYPGRISPQDAAALGIVDHGLVSVSKGSAVMEVPVSVDERMQAGTIFVPLGHPQCPVNRLGPGPVSVARREEVHSA